MSCNLTTTAAYLDPLPLSAKNRLLQMLEDLIEQEYQYEMNHPMQSGAG